MLPSGTVTLDPNELMLHYWEGLTSPVRLEVNSNSNLLPLKLAMRLVNEPSYYNKNSLLSSRASFLPLLRAHPGTRYFCF